ncbi:hypothetical protein BPAE_0277g00020 [Botrytis paeoniae]|uniref:Uncharacterized protein n=1 Tax=Botrytis paeoniae TaxID=278948 RepID=A0A4Z1FGQ6_9HELO|nr:hypothetical protein BPAE_0277g00020 [Botrytis paeoniae]
MPHYYWSCRCLAALQMNCTRGEGSDCNLLSIDNETQVIRDLDRFMGTYNKVGRMISERALFGVVALSEGFYVELGRIIIGVTPRLVDFEYTE